MSKTYNYVGPKDLLDLIHDSSIQTLINNSQDILAWLQKTGQGSQAVATFIVDTGGKLWIAERGIEHVVCARGEAVLAAGEITFLAEKSEAAVEEITNQSTGYCPEPESWQVVEQALSKSRIEHPPYWTTSFIFRQCSVCRTINLVKDNWFYCAVCDAELPQVWNFQE